MLARDKYKFRRVQFSDFLESMAGFSVNLPGYCAEPTG